jgi:uncharacterized protein YbbC (DUF1343 family)
MRVMVSLAAMLFLCWFVSAAPQTQTKPTLAAELEAAVNQAIAAKQIPGAVILVLHQDKVMHHAAYGVRANDPDEPMTTDTLFDMASISKPIVTATCVMKLIEQGKLKPSDTATQHLPTFTGHGKEHITIKQLMLHISGLIADNHQMDYEQGRDEAIRRIDALKLNYPTGTRWVYSDVGYIVLGRIVEKLTGRPLDEVAKEWIFTPLGMKDTGYHRLPGKPRLYDRIAPTEWDVDGTMLRGAVHDPRAFRMGGVAGHAGLFTCTDDLLPFVRMLLKRGAPILNPETHRLLTEPHHLPGGNMRTLGWDMDTFYSAPRGDAFPLGLSYGHTGFTGTSIWIDPTSDTAVIILTSRLYPTGKGNAVPIRKTVADIVVKHLAKKPAPSPVAVGIDVLRSGYLKPIETKRIGLVTNHNGLARDGMSTIDILHQATNIKLTALFCPEHGIRGKLDETVKDEFDGKTGLWVYSLYGANRKPTAEQLKNVEILVYDVQDIGCRFYTYISTLGLVLEAAAENNIPVVVLDRPNPINGVTVQGPMLDAGKESFIAWHALPVRHGMTVGELAQLFNSERKIGAKLSVIKMKDWRREMDYSQTGLGWVNPSPNMRSLYAAWLYPGVGLWETTNLSVGRGTDRPFELVGAPWIDARLWAQHLEQEKLPGVRFIPTKFTPTSSVYAGKECHGVSIVLHEMKQANPLQIGFALAVTLKRIHPQQWETRKLNTLLLCDKVRQAIEAGKGVGELMKLSEEGMEAFRVIRNKYLLYD